MSLVIQFHLDINPVIIVDAIPTPATDEQTRQMFPDAPKRVLRYECCLPDSLRSLAEEVPTQPATTLADVLWGIQSGSPISDYADDWMTALLYLRNHREELQSTYDFTVRGNYDTLVYSMYRLCWEAMINPTATITLA